MKTIAIANLKGGVGKTTRKEMLNLNRPMGREAMSEMKKIVLLLCTLATC